MVFAGINYLAIVIAALSSFGFGALYYMSLAKPWMASIGKTEEDLKANSSKTPFIVTIVAELVMAWVLAGALGHLGPGQVSLRNGMITGFILWAGFVITTLAVNHAYEGAKRTRTLIDGGHWLGVLLIQGLVIGFFGV
jgi:hypothetical protein